LAPATQVTFSRFSWIFQPKSFGHIGCIKKGI
jgi:hypothetical protein